MSRDAYALAVLGLWGLMFALWAAVGSPGVDSFTSWLLAGVILMAFVLGFLHGTWMPTEDKNEERKVIQ